VKKYVREEIKKKKWVRQKDKQRMVAVSFGGDLDKCRKK